MANTPNTSSASPSPSKRKFQFQNNRTSPYVSPPVIRQLKIGSSDNVDVANLSHKPLTVVVGAAAAADEVRSCTPTTTNHAPTYQVDVISYPTTRHQWRRQTATDSNIVAAPPISETSENIVSQVVRPVELLHRRKVYVEGPPIVESTSSEVSTVNSPNCRSKDCRTSPTIAPCNGSRQISPASCNSESVASGAGACGLCGLMPHCSILDGGSAKARKIRGNTVIVEEETETATAEHGNLATTLAKTAKPKSVVSEAAATVNSCAIESNRIGKFNTPSMDRSVDSIGSCSLDVDADSTDFSGTVQVTVRTD